MCELRPTPQEQREIETELDGLEQAEPQRGVALHAYGRALNGPAR